MSTRVYTRPSDSNVICDYGYESINTETSELIRYYHRNQDRIGIDTYLSSNVISHEQFEPTLLYIVDRYDESFKGITLYITHRLNVTSRIYLSESTILKHGVTLDDGLCNVLNYIVDRQYIEVLEDYDVISQKYIREYGYIIEEFHLVYTYFTATYTSN